MTSLPSPSFLFTDDSPLINCHKPGLLGEMYICISQKRYKMNWEHLVIKKARNLPKPNLTIDKDNNPEQLWCTPETDIMLYVSSIF